jgi:hypothetical protein
VIMKIYAGSLIALLRAEGGVIYKTAPSIHLANNEDEATGKALRTCKEFFKQSDGFYGHAAVVLLIPDHMIKEAVITAE